MSTLFQLPKYRLDPLIDGIFAVALTVLVLEIKVPELAHPGSARELLQALGQHVPVVLAYFVSFGLLGMFWVWHHRLSDKVRETDGPVLACILAFLSLVCFFPFAAAVFGRYIVHGNVASLLVYLPLVGLILLSQTLYFYLAMRRGLLKPGLAPAEVASAHRRNVYTLGAFTLSCVPAALLLGVAPAVGCGVAGVLLLFVARRVTVATQLPAT